MGIFRGTGGSSVASTDAGVNQVTQDALAAENSAQSASQSASQASTSATNAANSASTAESHASNAAASFLSASGSATAAANSAAAAANAVTEINEVTEASVTQHEAALSITESQITDLGTYLTANQTITLTGDVTGSGSTSIEVTITDDSHNHVISNIDGLQTALDAKLDSIPAEYLTETEGDARYLQSFTEVNDLSTAVVWANIPDANVPQSAVTQHQAALAITASQVSGLAYYTDSAVSSHLNTGTATGGQILSWDGIDYDWVDVTGGDVVDDTTPQLGGNLDLNSSDITGTGNINITGDITATNFTGVQKTLSFTELDISAGTQGGYTVTGLSSTTKELILIFVGASLSSSDDMTLTIGDSGGLETSGYVSAAVNHVDSTTVTSTNKFTLNAGTSGSSDVNAVYKLYNVAGNTWVLDGQFNDANDDIGTSTGTKTLSGTLDRFRIGTSGSNNWDAGKLYYAEV